MVQAPWAAVLGAGMLGTHYVLRRAVYVLPWACAGCGLGAGGDHQVATSDFPKQGEKTCSLYSNPISEQTSTLLWTLLVSRKLLDYWRFFPCQLVRSVAWTSFVKLLIWGDFLLLNCLCTWNVIGCQLTLPWPVPKAISFDCVGWCFWNYFLIFIWNPLIMVI